MARHAMASVKFLNAACTVTVCLSGCDFTLRFSYVRCSYGLGYLDSAMSIVDVQRIDVVCSFSFFLTPDQIRLPAELKHISKRRKRN